MAELSHVRFNGQLLEIVDESARTDISSLQKVTKKLEEFREIAETSSTTMPNSNSGRLLVDEIGGVCEQFTTTGKNHMGIRTFDSDIREVKGITYTLVRNDDGSLKYINVNGTATETSTLAIALYDNIHLTVGEAYIMSGCPSGGASNEYRMHFYNTNGSGSFAYDIGSGVEFEFTNETTDYNIAINIYSGVTVNNLKFYPMIRKASVSDATYEPYTGGQPSPNPSYPQEIKKSVVSKITTHGKNFCKNAANSQTVKGVTFTVNDDGSVWVNGTAEETFNVVLDNTLGERLKVGDKYRLTGCPTGGSQSTYRLDCVRPGVTTYMLDGGWGSSAYTVTDNTINPTIRIWISGGVTLSNALFKPMLRKADVEDDTFEPYKESSITLSQPIELYGMGDLQDVITPKEVNREFAEKIFNGTETWQSYNSAKHPHLFMLTVNQYADGIYQEHLLCSHFMYDSGDLLGGLNGCRFKREKRSNIFYISSSLHTDVVSFKSWLAEQFENNTPVTIAFKLAEPITEELPIADQIALNSLQTYDGITYLEFDAEVQPTFVGRYGTSEVGGVASEAYCDSLIGNIVAQEHYNRTNNPHKVTKIQVGLGKVENKSVASILSEMTHSHVVSALGYTPIKPSAKGAANGVAELDASGRVPLSQLPIQKGSGTVDIVSPTVTPPPTTITFEKAFSSVPVVMLDSTYRHLISAYDITTEGFKVTGINDEVSSLGYKDFTWIAFE